MKIINSADDVKAVFPSVEFDETGVGTNENGFFLNCTTAYAYNPPMPTHSGNYTVDGEFSALQVQALAYWATHLIEFAVPNTQLPELELKVSVASAAEALEAFPAADFGADGVYHQGNPFVNGTATGDEGSAVLVLDGSFSLKQLLALVYWTTHMHEFAEVSAS